ncbi:MAG TPA: HlyC/CorC family transporter [Clostridiales bacterium]|nr:HlyC/CorC family transporter [Clostridiales bacterium]
MPDDAGGSNNIKKQNRLLKLFGLGDVNQITQKDIMQLIVAVNQRGIIEDSTCNVIENIFDFDDLTAGDIMTHRKSMVAVEDTEPLRTAVEEVIKTGYSRIPVYHEDTDNIVGVLYAKDLLKYVYTDVPDGFKLTDITRKVFYVPSTKNCSDLFSEMTSSKIQLAVVVDEYGGTDGLITLEDLIEAIVGNIQDEYDNEEDEVRKLSEKIYAVDGSTAVDEVSDLIGIELPDEDSDTVAGLMLEHLGKIPKENERPTVVINGVKFTAARIEKRRIARVLIETDNEELTED